MAGLTATQGNVIWGAHFLTIMATKTASKTATTTKAPAKAPAKTPATAPVKAAAKAPVKAAAKSASKAAAKTAATPAAKKAAAKVQLMTKAMFVELIAAEFELPKTRSADVLDFVFDTIKKSLKKTGTVSVSNFGTFKVAKRAARTGRNPQTGEAVKVKASKTVRFKPTPGYKDTL
jgi:DNA-binding protein HU-beta